ncbi:alpha-L-fucosidase [Pedobacter aquatilis]|uniref:alpha-L-fucosidase n=1 Tax=Pedobacter aquatilis TaxID=351343 RepID=UPI0025B3E016|nr:alpha-L-fucosidase [Pedobacter aquatilis]MDN3588495.1 alpha-L-fucosidase [Pedobacter aquatilis]
MMKVSKVTTFLSMVLLSLMVQQVRSQSKTSQTGALVPIPKVPPLAKIDSTPMGDLESFPEVELGLPIYPGPFKPTWESIEANYPGDQSWLRDAKFGIWVHFGPQASGESGDWYARKLYIPGTSAYKNHLEKYGHPSTSGYKEVLRDWNPKKLDPAKLAKIYKDAGAKFLMIQGVHHDNYDLWNSKYQPWNSVNIGPKRDLLAEWSAACRLNNIRYGVTFHHEYTWWWWQNAFASDITGDKAGIPYDGNLTLGDGKGKWWEGYDPKMLYGVDLREYKTVAEKAISPWSPPVPGIFTNHLDYAKWYASNWALRMMDVVKNYDPDFIYTDGTVQGPFTGNGTGTGYMADAMQSVMADYYNRTLKKRGKVNTFSIVKFRDKTNGTVTTEEFAIPEKINNNQPWIAEAPVGDWYYEPNFKYDSGMMIHYIIEAIARDGNAAICISILPDGSLDEGSLKMLKEVGIWMRRNGEAVYGSKAWSIPGEGEQQNGKLKMLPGGKLSSRQAEFKFNIEDFRFTVGKNNSLYAFCMTAPNGGAQLKIKSLGNSQSYLNKAIKNVRLLGYEGRLNWKQTSNGLIIQYPSEIQFATSAVFKIN